jgi:hypothetical protein
MTLDLKEFIRFIFDKNSEYLDDQGMEGYSEWKLHRYNKWLNETARQVFTEAEKIYNTQWISVSIGSELGDLSFEFPNDGRENLLAFTLIDNEDVPTYCRIEFTKDKVVNMSLECDDTEYYWSKQFE